MSLSPQSLSPKPLSAPTPEMRLVLHPVASHAGLTLERAGQALVCAGQVLDLAALPEGAVLPREAVACDWLAAEDIHHSDGVLHLVLAVPHPGPVLPPPRTVPLREGEQLVFGPGSGKDAPEPAPVAVDWARMRGPADRLAEARDTARGALAAAIAAARAAMITVLPGQDLIYQAKETEARAWIGDPAPDLADYPLLAAETGISAPDPDALAQLWLNMAALWRAQAARLEALRLTTGAAIDAAATPGDIAAVLARLPPPG